MWFDLSLVGGWFEGAAKLLPFLHAVELEQNIVAGNFSAVLGNILPVAIYAVVAAIGATLLFLRQMKKN